MSVEYAAAAAAADATTNVAGCYRTDLKHHRKEGKHVFVGKTVAVSCGNVTQAGRTYHR